MMGKSIIEKSLLEEFPRRPAAELYATKWKGKKGSLVYYDGPSFEHDYYEQIADAQIVGDAVYIPLGKGKKNKNLFIGAYAPIRDCKLAN